MTTWMWVIAVITVTLPFLLMWGFNRGNRADSAGRRISRRWHH